MQSLSANSLRLSTPVAFALLCLLIAAERVPAQSAAATAPGITPLQVDRTDPASSRIVPANAKLERIATGFTWVEGPVWVNNSLFFADIPSNSIRRWTPGKGVSIFLQPSGYKGSAPYGGREPGSNGMTLDALGRLTVAGHAQRDISDSKSLNPEAVQTVLADRYQGLRLNSPNDLVYRSDGSHLLHRSALRVAQAERFRSGKRSPGQRRLSHSASARPKGRRAACARRPAASHLRFAAAKRDCFLARREVSLRRLHRAQEDLDALPRAARRHARRSYAAL